MLPFEYYFWNSYKKTGYKRGKLNRTAYDKQVNQQGKSSDNFIKNLVDSVLENQSKTVKDNKTTLEIEYNKADKELTRIQSLKSEEENQTYEVFSEKNEALEKEKSEIEQDLANHSLLEVQQLDGVKQTLGKLTEFLQNRAEDVKSWVVDQSEKLLQQWKSALKHNTKVTAQEIKENVIQNNEIKNIVNKKDISQKEKSNNKLGRSLGYLIFLILMCIFDIVLGYGVAYSILDTGMGISGFYLLIAAFFVALFVIPLAIGLVHFSVKGMGGGENKSMSRQLGFISIILVIIIVLLYIFQSTPDLLKSLWPSYGNVWDTINSEPGILFRSFLIPSLFAGEVIIELIDWDLILDYFGIGKRKGPNSLSKLINNGLYFLKSRKISNYAKEEKKALENIIADMQKEEIPAIAEIKKDIKEIQSVLEPIRNKQSEKEKECYEKLAIIERKKEKNQADYDASIKEIEDKYEPEIRRLDNIKKVNEIKINKIEHDFNKHAMEVEQGIYEGLLVDK